MNDYTPKVGDRVRVVLEGEVSEVYSGSWTLAKTNGFTHDAEHVVSIEKLPNPEPEWQPGDVVIGSEGTVLLRTVQSKWVSTSGYFYRGDSDLDIARPLTHLVRNGKPVQS